jgi:hypothetical protein
MSRFAKKLIAVLLLLWLPVFAGNAVATSIVMQLPAGHCHDQSMQMDEMDMADMDMSGHDISATSDNQTNCHSCSVCHFAYTGYVAVAAVVLHTTPCSSGDITPYLVDAHSFTSAPLLPPPLARV